MSLSHRLRDWLLRIPVAAVCAAAVVLNTLFSFIARWLGEAGGLVGIPFLFTWLVCCALILAYAHRAFASNSLSLLRFGAPIFIALAFLVGTACIGGVSAAWIINHFHI